MTEPSSDFNPINILHEAFDVFHSVQGNQGKLGKASKQQLENTFGTSRDDDVVKFMLENGDVQGNIGISGTGGDARWAQLTLFPIK